MKLKFDNLKEKAKTLAGKVGRKTIIVTASITLIGVAVLLNFILMGGGDRDGLKTAIDLKNIAETKSGEDTPKDTDKASAAGEDYFSTMVLSRRQARDEAMEVLQGVVDSDSAVDQMKTDAMEDMRRIADEVALEANIESLIVSKGFEQCVAVLNGDSASVIVKSDGLLPNEVSQISEIVYEQAGVLPANLNIIEK